MDPALPTQGSAPGRQRHPDPGELRLRVDFYRKLGYSSAEVRAALQTPGLSPDTNSVLGELVRSRASLAPVTPSPEERQESAEGPTGGPGGAPGRPGGPHSDTPPPAPPSLEDKRSGEGELKPIVIDGSNVAMSHGNKEVFSCRGIELAVDYFLGRGHMTVTVFVPSWRKEQPRPDAPITEQHILSDLERRKIVVFTPSRRVGGKRVVCYDDRFIVKLAHESDGVIVSNDTYRDLQGERPEWRRCIEERLLMYSFVNDMFMPPDDPLGRHGPSLDNFLRKRPLPAEQRRQLCPYDKKCTYGLKCKFYHPERTPRSYRSLADELRDNARLSTAKEDKNPALSLRGPKSDPGPALNFNPRSLEHELEHRLTLDQVHQQGRVSENQLLYWDRPGGSHGNVSGAQQAQQERPPPGGGPGPPPSSSADPPSSSSSSRTALDQLDSGLGSWESLYSDGHPPGHSSQLYRTRTRPPQGFTPRPPHPDRPDLPPPCPSCRCCSHAAPPTGQSGYDAYPQYPPSVHHYSLPCHLQHSAPPPQRHKYWSDPYQEFPPPAAGFRSLPVPPPPPSSSSSSSPGPPSPSPCAHGAWRSWGGPGPGPPPPAAADFDPEREEVRKKLQAIFSPGHVDVVMAMFPRLRNAQTLAAEILNLKSQGVLF